MTAAALAPANPDFEAAVRAGFARQEFMGTLGAWLVAVAPGRVSIEVPFVRRLAGQHGLYHGGVVAAAAECAGGLSALSLLPAGAEIVTVDYKLNVMCRAAGVLLRADGQVIRAGRSLTVARIDVAAGTSGAMTACAVIQATFLRG